MIFKKIGSRPKLNITPITYLVLITRLLLEPKLTTNKGGVNILF